MQTSSKAKDLRLKVALLERGITHQQVADYLRQHGAGISEAGVSRIVTHRQEPTPQVKRLISELVELPSSELL